MLHILYHFEMKIINQSGVMNGCIRYKFNLRIVTSWRQRAPQVKTLNMKSCISLFKDRVVAANDARRAEAHGIF